MASMTAKTEVAFTADGRDEETLRRFYEQLGRELEYATRKAADLFSGVQVTETVTQPAGMTVRK